MKKIEATVAPFQIDAISDALDREGIHGITVSEVRTSALRRGQFAHYRGAQYELKFVQGMKIEILLDDFEVPKVVALIRMLARSAGAGDGGIFVIPVADAVRIRTGQRGRVTSFPSRI